MESILDIYEYKGNSLSLIVFIVTFGRFTNDIYKWTFFFIFIIIIILKVDATKHTLAKYLMELTIIELDMVHIRPSHIAASALYLSMLVLDGSRWVNFPTIF